MPSGWNYERRASEIAFTHLLGVADIELIHRIVATKTARSCLAIFSKRVAPRTPLWLQRLQRRKTHFQLRTYCRLKNQLWLEDMNLKRELNAGTWAIGAQPIK